MTFWLLSTLKSLIISTKKDLMVKSQPMITLQNLNKVFRQNGTRIKALNNVSLTIKDGEFVAITGPSGSGKTTLLNIIGGLDRPSEGEVFINKKKINKLKDKEISAYRNHEVGFVFQEFYLEPFLSVSENILLPTFFSKNKIDKKPLLYSLLEEVSLKNRSSAPAKSLSGGGKQRVAIARALINTPKIILADEPTGNLDQATGKKIITLLKRLHKKHHATLIIATHDPLVSKSAERIIRIKDGKIVTPH